MGLTWRQMSEYYITSGKYSVSKCHVLEEIKYTAWYGREIFGVFDEAIRAKEAAEVHIEFFRVGEAATGATGRESAQGESQSYLDAKRRIASGLSPSGTSAE